MKPYTVIPNEGDDIIAERRKVRHEFDDADKLAAFLAPHVANDDAYTLWVQERDEDEQIVEQMNGEEWMLKHAILGASKC